MESVVKKAIIPIAGLGIRFLPVTKIIPKESLPLVDKPIFQYLVEEAITCGIKEIIFITSPEKTKYIKNYFSPLPKLEKILKNSKKIELLEELEKIPSDLKIEIVEQKKPLGDGDAVLRAKNFVLDEPCAVLFGDDIVDADPSCLWQLLDVFKRYKQTVLALERVPEEKTALYGIVDPEKIANRLYKVRRIVEKPDPKTSPSDLAIVGKYIITPELFNFLQDLEPNQRGEIILADAFYSMIKKGKLIYGYEYKGKWWPCRDKLGYLKANVHFGISHPKLGKDFKNFLKELKL